MFILSESLLDRPVMSLRTGGKIAITKAAIFNPNNLKIEGFYCEDRFDKKSQLILITQDIRDNIPNGIVVNDHEVLATPQELVRLKDILEINFELVGKPVYTESKKKIGKVTDFAADDKTYYVQKLYVSQPIYKNPAGGNLSVDRGQIIEITNSRIIIKDPLQPIVSEASQPLTATAAS